MFKHMVDKEIYRLLCECVENDTETFSFNIEKDLFLCILKHFFALNNCDDFFNAQFELDVYNQFYKEVFQLYFTDLELKILANEEIKNEKT